VTKHADYLKNAPQFSNNDSEYNVFAKWGLQFAEYAMLVLGESEADKDIKNLEKEIAQLNIDKVKHEQMMKLYQNQGFMNALTNTENIDRAH